MGKGCHGAEGILRASFSFRTWGNLLETKVKVKSLSRVRLFVTPWTIAYLDMQSEQSQSQAGMQCLSLILLTTRKQSFTRTQVHSIISQKSILRNAKPQCREGTDISVSCPGSNSTLIERLLYSRHCVWDTEQI